MSRICVPGLLALLAAAPHPARGGDEADVAGGKIELKVQAAVKAVEVKAAAVVKAVAVGQIKVQAAAPLGVALEIVQKEADDGAEADEEPAGRVLSAEEKKAMEDFVKKGLEARRKQAAKAMEQRVADEVKEVKLEKAAEKKLESLIPKAVDASMPGWEKEFRKWLQPIVQQSGEGAAGIEKWQAEAYIRNVPPGESKPPQDTDEWKNGLKAILTAEQWTAREEAMKSEDKKFQEEMGDYLATCEGQAGDQMASTMDTVINRIMQFGEIDEARQKKLKAAADEAVKLTVKDWRGRTEKQLKATPKEQREQMANRGGIMGVDTTSKDNQPQEKQVWKDALAQILTDAERKTIEDRRMEVRGRRAEALALILVADLDRLIGFSDKQRGEFLALCSKRMLKLPESYFTSPETGGYYSIDPGQMLQQVKGLKTEQLAAILDEGQMKRWKSTSSDQLSRSNSYVRTKIDTGDVPKPEDMDEVEVERILSGFLHREARKMKLKVLSQMEAQVEQIRRVVNPSPDIVAVLTTAAKGAAEEMAANSITNLSSWVRGQFQNMKPSDVPARLQNLYNPYFSERNQTPVPRLWTTTVERLLNEAQRSAWKGELDTREAWRRKGLSAMVLTDLEKRIILKPEQREKLHVKITQVIEQYEPDFANYFSFGWHLQGYYAMIPIAMLSDKEMEEHFDKKQIETVKEKCLQNASQYAEMIRRQHKSRTNK